MNSISTWNSTIVGSGVKIIQCIANDRGCFALLNSGQVLFAGDDYYNFHPCRRWQDIVQIACGPGHLVGLRSDGRCFAVGANSQGQCDVQNFPKEIRKQLLL